MNKKNLILLVLLVLLFAAGFAVWHKRPVPASMRLALTGTTGLKVAGRVVVDGIPREFSGVLPTSLSVQARRFEYTILMQEALGELRGELTVANGVYGSSSTANDFSGVRGSYSHTWLGKGGMMTTARKGE